MPPNKKKIMSANNTNLKNQSEMYTTIKNFKNHNQYHAVSYTCFLIGFICGGIAFVAMAFKIDHFYYFLGLLIWFLIYIYFGSVYMQSIKVWEITHSLKPIPVKLNFKKLGNGIIVIIFVGIKLLLLVAIAQVVLEIVENGLILLSDFGWGIPPYLLAFLYCLAFLGVVTFFFFLLWQKGF